MICGNGCATLCKNRALEASGSLKGSLATTINQRAIEYHQKHLAWPDAQYLAKHAGLSIQNQSYGTNLSVYVIDKPYQDLPETFDITQTFVFCAYYSPIDSSRYTYCRIYYHDKKNCFTASSSDGQEAMLWSLVMEAENHFLDFTKQIQSPKNQSKIAELAGQHAMMISEISPDDLSRNNLFALSYQMFMVYYQETRQLEPTSPEFCRLLDNATRRLARLIYYQPWRTK